MPENNDKMQQTNDDFRKLIDNAKENPVDTLTNYANIKNVVMNNLADLTYLLSQLEKVSNDEYKNSEAVHSVSALASVMAENIRAGIETSLKAQFADRRSKKGIDPDLKAILDIKPTLLIVQTALTALANDLENKITLAKPNTISESAIPQKETITQVSPSPQNETEEISDSEKALIEENERIRSAIKINDVLDNPDQVKEIKEEIQEKIQAKKARAAFDRDEIIRSEIEMEAQMRELEKNRYSAHNEQNDIIKKLDLPDVSNEAKLNASPKFKKEPLITAGETYKDALITASDKKIVKEEALITASEKKTQPKEKISPKIANLMSFFQHDASQERKDAIKQREQKNQDQKEQGTPPSPLARRSK